jgi:cellulose synthase/poly-beta-1,6-N-acetylglucosamine synthase-like glycosyltransferase
MIIDITKSGYQRGYLPKKGIGVFHPFFATANAAFRREAITKAGEFDPHCRTGEDIDLSIRVAKEGFEMWFQPSAKIVHHHRYSLTGLLKQWFAYGMGHAYLYKKHSRRRRLQFYRYDLSNRNQSPFGVTCILDLPFPIYSMVFLSSYHFMHIFLILVIVAVLFSWFIVGTMALIGFLCCAIWYFGIRFEIKKPSKSFVFSGLRYVADSAYVIGGLLGGMKEGVIYIEATRTRKRTKRNTKRT